MKKYPTYKPSGVEWIGNIPDNWDFKKIKYLIKHISISTYIKEEDETYIALENIESWTGKIILNEALGGFESTAKKFTENDILFGKLRPYLAKVVMPDFKGVCVSEILVLRPISIIREFLYYILLNPNFIDFVSQTAEGTKMPRTSWAKIGELKFPLPTKRDQLTIVQFLHYKTSEIDSFIASRQNQIELLKVQKAGIINKAVTKGIKPNAKMKASGIEWLPEVPESWEVWRMKFLSKIGTGNKNTEDAEDDGAYPFYVRSDNVERISSYSFEGEAILTAGDGVGVAKVYHYANGKMAIHQRVYKISHFKRVLGEFLYYYIKDNFEKEVIKLSAKTTVDSLRMHMLGNFPVAHPSKEEQNEILDFIKTETTIIDNLISKYQKQIDLMQEYRTSLISQTVTGKIDVRDWKLKK